MKYGISTNGLLGYSPTNEDLLILAREAESLGFHSIIVSDHIVIPSDFDTSTYPAGVFDSGIPWYDPFILLAAMAGVTKTIRLGTGIAVVPYRPPVQQAQAIATLDFISGGRFFYGAGVGWMREEFDALGVPFAERGQRADEYIEVMKRLWSGSGEGFHGKSIHFDGGRINPLPTQRPHPPILVGGETPPALRRIARHGDGFYINWKTLSEFDNLLDQLSACMAENGREVSDLYKALGATKVELVRKAKAAIPDYEAMGLDEIIYAPTSSSVEEGMDAMREFADEFF